MSLTTVDLEIIEPSSHIRTVLLLLCSSLTRAEREIATGGLGIVSRRKEKPTTGGAQPEADQTSGEMRFNGKLRYGFDNYIELGI